MFKFCQKRWINKTFGSPVSIQTTDNLICGHQRMLDHGVYELIYSDVEFNQA